MGTGRASCTGWKPVPTGWGGVLYIGEMSYLRRDVGTLREDAFAIWKAGVEAVRGDRLVRGFVQVAGGTLLIGDLELPLDRIGKIAVVGGGKAGAGMALGLEQALGPELCRRKLSGILNVPADCASNQGTIELVAARPAGVNEPRREGVLAAARMRKLVSDLRSNDLCICLLSGGGSALLPLPRDGITLDEKLAVTRFLASRGANIEELNTVRKQLSAIKGGQLASACGAGTLVTLVISDVMGDPLEVIASGPTYPDTSTPNGAQEILERFGGASETWFAKVCDVLSKSKLSAPARSAATHHFVIGNNAVAVDAAGVEAERRGYSHAMTSSRKLEGSAEELGRSLARLSKSMRTESGPDCLISGGEPVVAWDGKSERGLGGRNQQLILAALAELKGATQGMVMLSGGTDGEDGPTDAAGAWIDERTPGQAARAGLEPMDYLMRQDAYHFFERIGGLIKTGPTHTNVGDVRVVVVERVADERNQSRAH
jgi:glycerate 2-kinase